MDQRPILVTGAHRSGTTWVGQMLSLPPSVGYLHEPFNLVYRPSGYGVHPEFWYQYIHQGNAFAYAQRFRQILNFKPISLAQTRFQGIDDAKIFLKRNYELTGHRLMRRRALIKDPLALFATPWLVKEFGMQPVVLIRHPAAFVNSVTKQGWRFNFQHLASQPELLADWLRPFKADIEQAAKSDWSAVAEVTLLWLVTHTFIDHLEGQHPDWTFIKHEDIAKNPESVFQDLYHTLGLPWDSRVAAQISAHSVERKGKTTKPRNPVNHIQRDSHDLIHDWEHELDQDSQRYVIEQTKHLASKWYHLH